MPAVKARKFTFTSFDSEEPVFDSEEMNYLIYGKETAPTTGRVHWQSYVEFKNQKTFNQAKRCLPDRAHLEVARGSKEQNKAYCSKEGDFKEFGSSQVPGARNDLVMVKNRILAGEKLSELMIDDDCADIVARHMPYFRKVFDDFMAGSGLSALKDRMAGVSLRPFQSALVRIISEPVDPRKVYWTWDHTGGSGKSFFTDYLVAFHGAVVFTGGRVCDIAHAYNYQRVVIFDLARTMEEKLDAVFQCIENFKNGRFFSAKYESHCKVFSPPHVIVFSNFGPDRSKLSADRWVVWQIAGTGGSYLVE